MKTSTCTCGSLRTCPGRRTGTTLVNYSARWLFFGRSWSYPELIEWETSTKFSSVLPSCCGYWRIYGGEITINGIFKLHNHWYVSFHGRMMGELHDHEFPNEPLWYPSRTIQAGHIMKSSLLLLALYYLIIRPFNIMPPSVDSIEAYNDTGLPARVPSLFSTWRDYEHLQWDLINVFVSLVIDCCVWCFCSVLCWLGKDTAWNTANLPMWLIFSVPTIIISLDFIYTSSCTKVISFHLISCTYTC